MPKRLYFLFRRIYQILFVSLPQRSLLLIPLLNASLPPAVSSWMLNAFGVLSLLLKSCSAAHRRIVFMYGLLYDLFIMVWFCFVYNL